MFQYTLILDLTVTITEINCWKPNNVLTKIRCYLFKNKRMFYFSHIFLLSYITNKSTKQIDTTKFYTWPPTRRGRVCMLLHTQWWWCCSFPFVGSYRGEKRKERSMSRFDHVLFRRKPRKVSYIFLNHETFIKHVHISALSN